MSLSPLRQTSSAPAGAITLLVLALSDSLSHGQVTLIDFETIPPYPANVDSFGDIFPGLTFASDNQWLADEGNNSLFENIHGRSITTLGDAPLTVRFDSPKRDIRMDLGSGTLGMGLTIGITGYVGGQPVFFDSFVTHPVASGADEVRAHTFGIVDTFVVRRTAGSTSLTLDNLFFAAVPEPGNASLLLAIASVLFVRLARSRNCFSMVGSASSPRSACAPEDPSLIAKQARMEDVP